MNGATASHPKPLKIVIVFLTSLLIANLYTMLSAQIFAGHCCEVGFRNEMPNALMLALAMTGLYVARKYVTEDAARGVIKAGFWLLILGKLIEVLVNKYTLVHPLSAVNKWLFIFTVVLFGGTFLVLVGFSRLAAARQQQEDKL